MPGHPAETDSPPNSVRPSLSDAEYSTLRATIRERGSLRVLVFVAGLSAWAFVLAIVADSSFLPYISLIPLVLLFGVFEAVNALHLGVERVGRYVEVFYEAEPDESRGKDERYPRWETTTMEYGRRFGGRSPDPLFCGVFATAVLLNVLPVMMVRPTTAEWLTLGGLHLALLGRLVWARRFASEERARDVERFRAMARGPAPQSTTLDASSSGSSSTS